MEPSRQRLDARFVPPTRRSRSGIRPCYSGLQVWPARAGRQGTATAPSSTTKKTGAYDRARTDDLRFTKPLLYQLSYVGILPVFASVFGCFGQINTLERSLITIDKEPAEQRLELLRQKFAKLNIKAGRVLFAALTATRRNGGWTPRQQRKNPVEPATACDHPYARRTFRG